MNLTGIHHLTAVASDPARNVDFYTRVLGQRLVKRTVNFDDPGTYHLYYGDASGTPGTILTFFPWPGAPRGIPGNGQVTSFAYGVPAGSLGYWEGRLATLLPEPPASSVRFGERVLALRDPDGFLVEVVETNEPRTVAPWVGSDIPPEHALRGFHSVTLSLDGHERTARLLTGWMGARFEQSEGNRHRYLLGEGPARARLDLLSIPGGRRGGTGAGIVHHIAWRTPDDPSEEQAREELTKAGVGVSPVTDRNYFHSIYFREPGGVLFEIATDPPGFAVDEDPAHLGEKLMLPAWYEPRRAQIEAILPALR